MVGSGMRMMTGAVVIIMIIYSLFILSSLNAHASVVNNIPIGKKDQGYSPYDVAVNHNTNTVYATSPDSNTVAVINASSNEVVETISVGNTPTKIAINQNTSVVYVANDNSGTVSVINGSTNKIMRTLKVTEGEGGFYSIGGIAVNEKTNKIYILVNNDLADPAYASISIIDGLTNNLEKSFKIADLRWDYDVGDSARGIALNSNTNMIYVTMIFGSLYIIDGSDNKVLTSLIVGRMPTEVEVNEETNRVYISDFGSQLLFVMDGLTNRVVDTIWIGYDPQGIAIDSVTNTIYVAGPGVSVINGSSNQVVSRVETGEFPLGIAFNQNNGLAYVARWQSDSVFVIEADNETNNEVSVTPLSQLRQNTTSGKYIVELGWEFKNANDVTLVLSFFDSSGIPLVYMQYDLVIRNASNGETVQQFTDQVMFSAGRHDITFGKGGNYIQIDVIIKSDNQEPILNDKATFDIVIVPEFSTSIPLAMVMTIAIVIAILWRGPSGRKIG